MFLSLLFLLFLNFVNGQQQPPIMNDQIALAVQSIWKSAFPSAALLPGIGLPSQNHQQWFILTHQVGEYPVMFINGLQCLNPLCTNALYSSELSNNLYTNYYEIMLQDLPGNNGQLSSVQVYLQALMKNGLLINGVHFHWLGTAQPFIAIHHTSPVGMSPIGFSYATIDALKTYFSYITNFQTRKEGLLR